MYAHALLTGNDVPEQQTESERVHWREWER
jgi:hypothetical protein